MRKERVELEERTSVAHCAVRVLEDAPGLLVGADFLHADLLQAGRLVTAVNVSLLTGDQGTGMLLLQEY